MRGVSTIKSTYVVINAVHHVLDQTVRSNSMQFDSIINGSILLKPQNFKIGGAKPQQIQCINEEFGGIVMMHLNLSSFKLKCWQNGSACACA